MAFLFFVVMRGVRGGPASWFVALTTVKHKIVVK